MDYQNAFCFLYSKVLHYTTSVAEKQNFELKDFIKLFTVTGLWGSNIEKSCVTAYQERGCRSLV